MTAVERRKNKRKVDRGGKEDEKEELSKLQKSVVSWLKSNVPSKKTKFEHSHVVEYFSATKVWHLVYNRNSLISSPFIHILKHLLFDVNLTTSSFPGSGRPDDQFTLGAGEG